MGFIKNIGWKYIFRNVIFLSFLLLFVNMETFSESPLILDINLGDEIWLEGKIEIFNGWPPNLRMLVMDDYIIGIDENNVPEELANYLNNGLLLGGMFKLKLIGKTNIPYYATELLLFRIIEYKNIELLIID